MEAMADGAPANAPATDVADMRGGEERNRPVATIPGFSPCQPSNSGAGGSDGGEGARDSPVSSGPGDVGVRDQVHRPRSARFGYLEVAEVAGEKAEQGHIAIVRRIDGEGKAAWSGGLRRTNRSGPIGGTSSRTPKTDYQSTGGRRCVPKRSNATAAVTSSRARSRSGHGRLPPTRVTATRRGRESPIAVVPGYARLSRRPLRRWRSMEGVLPIKEF